MSAPSLSSAEKPSNSATLEDPSSAMNQAVESIGDGGASKGSTAAQDTQANVKGAASEVEKAANKLYEERIEDEYAKREGGA